MDRELEEYMEGISSSEPDYLSRLLRDSDVETINGHMNSGHLQGRLLKMLTAMIHPRRALELGTFCGYSACCIAEGLGEDARLVTVEVDEEREEFILRHLAEAPCGGRIELVIADCLEYMRGEADGSFDMIFMDADKRHYPEYLAEAARILTPGGFLLADNTLWYGHVVESRRHDPQTLGIREFNRELAAMPGWDVVLLPLRDGLTLARKPRFQQNPEAPECVDNIRTDKNRK